MLKKLIIAGFLSAHLFAATPQEVIRHEAHTEHLPATYSFIPRHISEKPVIRILSMDGGGIRGYIHTLMMLELKRLTGIPVNQMFHYIAGTSAGGILACALATLEPEQLKEMLFNERNEIFNSRFASLGGFANHKYHSPKDVLRKYLGDDWFEQQDSNDLRLMVTAFNMVSEELQILDNFRPATDYFKTVDVACATSAAPTYFPPHECVSRNGKSFAFLDGGVAVNNPSLKILNDISSLTPRCTNCSGIPWNGTRKQCNTSKRSKKFWILGWVLCLGLVDFLMRAPNKDVENELAERFRIDPRTQAQQVDGAYFRFNPTLEKASMDDTSDAYLTASEEATRNEFLKPEMAAIADFLSYAKHPLT